MNIYGLISKVEGPRPLCRVGNSATLGNWGPPMTDMIMSSVIYHHPVHKGIRVSEYPLLGIGGRRATPRLGGLRHLSGRGFWVTKTSSADGVIGIGTLKGASSSQGEDGQSVDQAQQWA